MATNFTLAAGRMTERITLQAPTETRGADYADPQVTWANVATVWAAVEPLVGREYFAQREQQSAVTVRIRIRYRADVTAKWRVLHGARVYEVESAICPAAEREQVVLMCTEYGNG